MAGQQQEKHWPRGGCATTAQPPRRFVGASARLPLDELDQFATSWTELNRTELLRSAFESR